MQTFAIFDLDKPQVVAERLEKLYPGRYYELDDGEAFLVAAQQTTDEVAKSLGITGTSDGGTGGLVLAFNSYHGVHYKKLWEWISVQQSS